MSQAPHVVRNARFGLPLGAPTVFEDSLWTGLTDTFCKLPMALTAEKLAEVYKVTRKEVDEYALRSQTLWKKGTLQFYFFHIFNLISILNNNAKCTNRFNFF